MSYEYAFIITYSHAGGTLLQEVLNQAPDTCIRGENAGTLFAMSRAMLNVQTATCFSATSNAPNSNWYGAGQIQATEFISEAIGSFVRNILNPPEKARLIGFAETRHLLPETQLFEYLDFLRLNFPKALLIFSTRDTADVLAKANTTDPAPYQRADQCFAAYAQQHPASCLELRYDDYIVDETALEPMFNRLSLPFDREATRKTLSRTNPALALPKSRSPGTIENGVIIGKQDWLFLWRGSNMVRRYYTDPYYFGEKQTQEWVHLLQARRDRLAQIGATYRHLTVPDKISVYPDMVAAPLPHYDRHPARQTARYLPKDLNIDILADLQALDSDCFYKTDTHWTFAGCYAAYRQLCASLDVTPRVFPVPDDPARDIAMDLGEKFSPPILEQARFVHIQKDAHRVSANQMVRYNEAEGLQSGRPRFVGCHIQTLNDAPDARPETVVLFGDSFSEFRPHLLTAMLAETFRELHFVWSTNLDHDFIARIRPQIVVTEIAERFMATLPSDNFRVSTD